MAQIHVQDGQLVVRMDGLSRLATLRDRIAVPLTHVVQAQVRPEPPQSLLAHLRAMTSAGTHIPGLLKAGTFVAEDGLVFYALRDGRRAIEIVLRQERFRRLIVEAPAHEEPAACVQRIRAAADQARGTPPPV
jgi:hypothetical protein